MCCDVCCVSVMQSHNVIQHVGNQAVDSQDKSLEFDRSAT